MNSSNTNSHYCGLSIFLHWLCVVALIGSFVTGEQLEGPSASRADAYVNHVSWSFLLGIPLLVRIVWRCIDGFRHTAPQHALLHIVSRVVMISFLIVSGGAVITGLLLPWSSGEDLNIASLSVASPFGPDLLSHEPLEQLHSLFSHLWIPLLLLHVLGALKHALIDKDQVFYGIFWPQK